jgi:hypothetical protein
MISDMGTRKAVSFVRVGALAADPGENVQILRIPKKKSLTEAKTLVVVVGLHSPLVLTKLINPQKFSFPNTSLRDTAGSSVSVGQVVDALPTLSVQEAVLTAAQHVAEPQSDELQATDQFGEPLRPPKVDLSGFVPKSVFGNAEG